MSEQTVSALDAIIGDVRAGFEANRRLLSFEQFIDVVLEHPTRHTRSAAHNNACNTTSISAPTIAAAHAGTTRRGTITCHIGTGRTPIARTGRNNVGGITIGVARGGTRGGTTSPP